MPIVTRVPDNFGPRYEVPGTLRCTQLLQVAFAAMASPASRATGLTPRGERYQSRFSFKMHPTGRNGSALQVKMQLGAASAEHGRNGVRPQRKDGDQTSMVY